MTLPTALTLAWLFPLLCLAALITNRWRGRKHKRFTPEDRRVILRRARKVRRER